MFEKIRPHVERLPHPVRWLVVLVLGALFIVAGLAMLVLPGPGVLFLGIGFAILAIEFTWAEVILHRATHHGKKVLVRVKVHARLLRRRIAARKSTDNEDSKEL